MAPVTIATSRFKVFRLMVGCAAFTVVSLKLASGSEGAALALTGVVGVIFFGGVGAFACAKMWRNRTLVRLTDSGLSPASGGLVPWTDVEAAGPGRIRVSGRGVAILGVRLSSYDRYLASLSPQEVRRAKAVAPFAKVAGAMLRPAMLLDAGNLWEPTVTPSLEPLAPLDLLAIPKGDLAAQMLWARSYSGWDLTWPAHMLTESAAEAAERINRYRQACSGT